MKTLGDYSEVSRNLTAIMQEIADGKVSVCKIGFNLGLLILQTDGMIEPLKGSDELQTIQLSANGKELLERGGYSEFK